MSCHVVFSHSSHVSLYLLFKCILLLYTSYQQYNHAWHPSDNLVLCMLQLGEFGLRVHSSEENRNNFRPFGLVLTFTLLFLYFISA